MEHNTVRPSSHRRGFRQSGDQSHLTKKVFNCIVDDSALIQGAKKGTRDGIPKWVAEGHLRLFVPLYALNQTTRLKERNGKASADAGDALTWLDAATSDYPELVSLQGGYEQYETWAEVEKYALPRPLFSEDDGLDSVMDNLPEQAAALDIGASSEDVGKSFSSNDSCFSQSTAQSARSLRSTSPLSPPTSPPKTNASLASTNGLSSRSLNSAVAAKAASATTPIVLQSLFNYMLWRVHHESNEYAKNDPSAVLDSFILLSDNLTLHKHAQRFGIRAKTVAEMRYIISRENQDAKNRRKVQGREAGSRPSSSAGPKQSENARPQSRRSDGPDGLGPTQDAQLSDEDEILLKRAPKAPAAFTRGSSVRGRGRGVPPSPRNFGSSPSTTPRGGRPTSSRSNRPGMGQRSVPITLVQQPEDPIDPNSFVRPSSSRGRGRGDRGLWMPG